MQAGGRLPMLADLVAGVRTGEMGGLPGAYVLQEGDPVIADIVPRLDGYWGDICGTHFVGAPSAGDGEDPAGSCTTCCAAGSTRCGRA